LGRAIDAVALRPAVWLGWIALLSAAPLSGQERGAEQAQAMAFVRVVADAGGLRRNAGADRAEGSSRRRSGFVVAPSGLVLTSRHVVAADDQQSRVREDEGEVTIENRRIEVVIGEGPGRRVLDAWVASSDAELDLAGLQVTAADLPYLPLGDSDALEPGRPVQVQGFPFGRQVEVGRPDDAIRRSRHRGRSRPRARTTRGTRASCRRTPRCCPATAAGPCSTRTATSWASCG
jgi:S1-C subfamily serine protease